MTIRTCVILLVLRGGFSLHLRAKSNGEIVSKWAGDMESSLVSDFVKWRHGDISLSSSEEDAALAQQIQNPSQDQLVKCSKTVPELMPRNLTHYFFNDLRIEEFLKAVDHIYVVCVKCQRSLPQSLLERATNIPAKSSDSCLGMHGHGHYGKATASHRLAITHARENAYKSILILEEDVSFDMKDTTHFDFLTISQLIRDETKDWEIIRIGWKNRGNELAKKSCRQHCECSTWVEQNMCTIESKGVCPLLSTSGYIMSSKIYNRFLNAGQPSAIDVYINHFKNTIITPPLAHQPAYDNEKVGDEPFAQKCKQEKLR